MTHDETHDPAMTTRELLICFAIAAVVMFTLRTLVEMIAEHEERITDLGGRVQNIETAGVGEDSRS